MRHEAVVETLAPEKYVLGELTGAEREEFEEHYFTCAECADEVRSAAALMDTLKAELFARKRALAVERTRGAWARLAGWFEIRTFVPAMAALGLLMIVSYQQLVTIPRLEQAVAPAVTATVNLQPETRGQAQVIAIAPGAPAVTLNVELSAPVAGPLEWLVNREDGLELFKLRGPASGNVTFRLPADRLPDGRYEAVAARADGTVIERFRFEIKRRPDSER